MSLETFFVEDPDYEGWLRAHPDGLVARLGIIDGGLGIHRVWCEEATPGYHGPGGMSGVRLCADTMDEMTEWADSRMVTSLSRCKGCSTPRLELLHHHAFG